MGAGTASAPSRGSAALAGVAYLVTIAAGVFAEAFVCGTLVVRDDAAATAANLLAREGLYRAGLGADLAMIAAYVVVTLLFYAMFKPVRGHASLLAAFFSMLGIAVLAADAALHIAPMLLLKSEPAAAAFEPTQLQALALLSLRLHSQLYVVAMVFFGVYCLLIGWLAFASRFLPKFIGVLMAIGGIGYLVKCLAILLASDLADRIPDTMALGGLAELALSLWLVLVGAGALKWRNAGATA